MKIDNAQILLGNTHHYARHHDVNESLVEGVNKPGTTWSADNLEHGTIFQRQESLNLVQISVQARFMSRLQPEAAQANRLPLPSIDTGRNITQDLLAGDQSALAVPEMPVIQGTAPLEYEVELSPVDGSKIQILVAMIELITGKKITIANYAYPSQTAAASTGSASGKQAAVSAETSESQSGEYGFAYHYSETINETEKTQFTARGQIQTTDGKKILIDLELNMSREFVSHNSIDIRAGAAIMKDPLVINFNGTAAQLTEEKFSFDIDADGTADQISFVGPDSGFLALDKNEDGLINNGSELFGALSGNGFSDLAQYDEDNNLFIDENDSIYNKLRIWSQDQQGNQQLIALGAANIGAIYLTHNSTPFDINNADNEQLGKIKSSGIYLTEDGSVGTVQQLDLVV